MKAIGYIRVSTSGQVTDGISLEMQEKKIRGYCDLNDMDLTQIIVDAGLSGKNFTGRAGAQELLTLIKNKQIDAVVCYKLDRLGRCTRDLLEVATLLDKKNVSLHSITEKLDTDSALGRFFFTLISAIAELERGIISERTKAALQCKKSNGEQVSFLAPFGYSYIDGMTVPDPHEQACIEHLVAIRQANPEIGWKKAANLLHKAGYKNRNNCKFGTSSMRILFSLTCHFSVDISKAA